MSVFDLTTKGDMARTPDDVTHPHLKICLHSQYHNHPYIPDPPIKPTTSTTPARPYLTHPILHTHARRDDNHKPAILRSFLMMSGRAAGGTMHVAPAPTAIFAQIQGIEVDAQ